MKKTVTLFIMMLIQAGCAFGWDTIHIKAMGDYSSTNPGETFQAQLVDDGEILDTTLMKGDILNLKLNKVKAPNRGKQDAKIYFNIINYENNDGVHEFSEPLVAKYSKSAINKEEIKKMPKKNIVKKGVGTVANHFFKGISYGISFVDGMVENEEGNRLKSGAKQVYDDSFLSLKDYGKEVEIKKDDEFYFVVKKEKDVTEENEVKETSEENDVKETPNENAENEPIEEK